MASTDGSTVGEEGAGVAEVLARVTTDSLGSVAVVAFPAVDSAPSTVLPTVLTDKDGKDCRVVDVRDLVARAADADSDAVEILFSPTTTTTTSPTPTAAYACLATFRHHLLCKNLVLKWLDGTRGLGAALETQAWHTAAGIVRGVMFALQALTRVTLDLSSTSTQLLTDIRTGSLSVDAVATAVDDLLAAVWPAFRASLLPQSVPTKVQTALKTWLQNREAFADGEAVMTHVDDAAAAAVLDLARSSWNAVLDDVDSVDQLDPSMARPRVLLLSFNPTLMHVDAVFEPPLWQTLTAVLRRDFLTTTRQHESQLHAATATGTTAAVAATATSSSRRGSSASDASSGGGTSCDSERDAATGGSGSGSGAGAGSGAGSAAADPAPSMFTSTADSIALAVESDQVDLNDAMVRSESAVHHRGFTFSVTAKSVSQLAGLLQKSHIGSVDLLCSGGSSTARRVLFAAPQWDDLVASLADKVAVTHRAMASFTGQTEAALRVCRSMLAGSSNAKPRRRGRSSSSSAAAAVVSEPITSYAQAASPEETRRSETLRQHTSQLRGLLTTFLRVLPPSVPFPARSQAEALLTQPWSTLPADAVTDTMDAVLASGLAVTKADFAATTAASPKAVVSVMDQWLADLRSASGLTSLPSRKPVSELGTPTPALVELVELLDLGSLGIAPEAVVCAVQTGSKMYNLNTEASDRDFSVIYLGATGNSLRLKPVKGRHAKHVHRPFGADKRDDTEFSATELEYFLADLTKGNARNLELLLAPEPVYASDLWRDLQTLAPAFVTRRCLYQYVGFVRDRLHRIRRVFAEGGHIQAVTKLLYHAFHKLLGLEALVAGKPLPVKLVGAERDFIMRIRTGPWDTEEWHPKHLAGQVEARLEAVLLKANDPAETAVTRQEVQLRPLVDWMLAVRTRFT